MASWEWFTNAHRAVYQKSGGRIGAKLMGIQMLLLTTVGRKSGLSRTLPLACFPDGGDLIVVASNDGQARDPAWWLNLQSQPEAEILVGRERRRVRALRATPEERKRLWPWLVKQNPRYTTYESRTTREIPVVILRRADS